MAQTARDTNAQPTVMDKVKGTLQSVTGSPMAKLDTDMRHVIDAFNALDPKDLPKLPAAEARQQPSAADAALQVLREQGKSSLPDQSVMAKNVLVVGAKEKIVATVYSPAGASGPLPAIVYYHGGGFAIRTTPPMTRALERLQRWSEPSWSRSNIRRRRARSG